ncbi:hypothetical protein L211DRAFT_302701 [Terfezia boudieri ATCC MYA-4762]|uniref:Uncharacterized protein n=1 Tax=Terfezia boudieri ATCC MYA-4762 TaxID=1051890 RepID=A0A3N4LIS3_9PEZI|nr:hypothetical protein L211DRAFT_302701 [Terfezia boudieri ATCC MYA-4762]
MLWDYYVDNWVGNFLMFCAFGFCLYCLLQILASISSSDYCTSNVNLQCSSSVFQIFFVQFTYILIIMFIPHPLNLQQMINILCFFSQENYSKRWLL